MLRKMWFVTIVLVVVISTVQPAFAAGSQAQFIKGSGPQTIPNQYIIVFKSSASDRSIDLALEQVKRGQGAVEHFRYRTAIKGFTATLNNQALESLRRNSDVAYVEQDQVVSIDTTQLNPDWGLDRIDQRTLPLS